MSVEERQGRLLGGPTGESVSIQTSGRIIRPALSIPAQLVGEAKLRFDADGLSVVAVDPANVGMVTMDVHPAAFDGYDVRADEEVLVGANLNRLGKNLSNARLGKSTDDPVDLDVDATRTVIEIEREYQNTTVRYAEEMLNIDPGSIRQEPDIPDLELTASATVDVSAFTDAIEHIDNSSDHVVFRTEGDSMILTGEGNEDSPSDYGSAVEFDDVDPLDDEDATPFAKYSLDYLKGYADGMKKAKVDEVDLAWGEELPLYIDFEREDDGETLYEATYILAPRLGGADDV